VVGLIPFSPFPFCCRNSTFSSLESHPKVSACFSCSCAYQLSGYQNYSFKRHLRCLLSPCPTRRTAQGGFSFSRVMPFGIAPAPIIPQGRSEFLTTSILLRQWLAPRASPVQQHGFSVRAFFSKGGAMSPLCAPPPPSIADSAGKCR